MGLRCTQIPATKSHSSAPQSWVSCNVSAYVKYSAKDECTGYTSLASAGAKIRSVVIPLTSFKACTTCRVGSQSFAARARRRCSRNSACAAKARRPRARMLQSTVGAGPPNDAMISPAPRPLQLLARLDHREISCWQKRSDRRISSHSSSNSSSQQAARARARAHSVNSAAR
jgi:hypothetical protein